MEKRREKKKGKEVPQEWPGEALQIRKTGVCTEVTVRMVHRRPAFASAGPGKQRHRGRVILEKNKKSKWVAVEDMLSSFFLVDDTQITTRFQGSLNYFDS